MYIDDESSLKRSGLEDSDEFYSDGKCLLRSALRGTVLIISLCVLGAVFHWLSDNDVFGFQWLDRQIDAQDVEGVLLFVAIGGLTAAVGFPRQFVAFGGGYVFGFIQGFCFALMAQGLGCLLTFLYARFFARGLAQEFFSRKLARIDRLLRYSPFMMSLLIRLLPVGSNLLTNILAGVTSVSSVSFISGSLIGYIPQTLIFSLLGSGVYVSEYIQIIVSIILFVVSITLGLTLWRRYKLQERMPQDSFF